MKLYLFLLLLVVPLYPALAQQPVSSREREVVFRGVHVIPMDKEQVIKNQTVVVKNGKITAIGNTGKVKYSNNALVVEGKGKYLIPGLAEMHAHVPPVDDLEQMKEVLQLFTLHGITTIRGMLGHPRHLELRSKLQSGELIGPRFYTSGPSLNGNSVKTPEAGAEMVRQQKQAGYDFLKLHPGLNNETFAAIASTANKESMPFAGHVSYDVGVWRAIEAGYASIDHMDGFVESLVPGLEAIPEQEAGLFAMFIADQADTTRIPKLMAALREKNIWVVPTQALAERWMSPAESPEVLGSKPEMKYMNPKTVQNWVATKQKLMADPRYDAAKIDRYVNLRRRLIKVCNDNQVGLLLGCDAPQVFNVPGISTHQELEYLVAAGLSPYEALKTGTIHVGRYFNREDIGTLKVGSAADLLLLHGNPLQDISQTQRIAGIVIGHTYLPEAHIKQSLKKLEKGN
ncbi:amidohydrolase family protein [Pontibacter ramchanderi]|uniref:Imidazolonepropionase-like amidohydrolase n=1 Tax=Pontibacter ramchanderi TaxID=1179743 RepID=A0A2N3U7C7_9BACT|nr:amidohydrolase family protein [Pontibacter ramchanderi]PKV62652.1 imidazolonepropionase-like amidohydrolase [Pontibacter ramchanderi]